MAETVVITGGKGFVGKYLVSELKKGDYEVDVWDLPEIDIVKFDSYKDRLIEIKPDWIVHLAAVSSVPKSYDNPELTRRVNVEATEKLLEVVGEVSPDTRFLVVSTSDIYGQGSASPLPELPLDQCKPISPYSKSKWVMEKIIEAKYVDRVIRVRPFPHIGPGQSLGFVTSDFASQIARIEKGEQEAVMKVGNLEAERDLTDVRDVVVAYRLLLGKGMLGEVYNIASGKTLAIQELLNRLLSLSTEKILVEEDPEKLRPSDIPILIGDVTRLKNTTGWQPVINLDQTLREILDYWRKSL